MNPSVQARGKLLNALVYSRSLNWKGIEKHCENLVPELVALALVAQHATDALSRAERVTNAAIADGKQDASDLARLDARHDSVGGFCRLFTAEVGRHRSFAALVIDAPGQRRVVQNRWNLTRKLDVVGLADQNLVRVGRVEQHVYVRLSRDESGVQRAYDGTRRAHRLDRLDLGKVALRE